MVGYDVNPVVKVGFQFSNRYGDKFKAVTQTTVHEGLGETERDVLIEQFNSFLDQIGLRKIVERED